MQLQSRKRGNQSFLCKWAKSFSWAEIEGFGICVFSSNPPIFKHLKTGIINEPGIWSKKVESGKDLDVFRFRPGRWLKIYQKIVSGIILNEFCEF